MLQVSFSPFPVLQTPRLRLRRMRLDDSSRLLELRSDPSVMRFLDKEPMTSLEEAQLMVVKIEESINKATGISWCITTHDSDLMIGNAALWRMIPEHYRAEIGYMLLPQYWGKGIMQEALQAVIRYGFHTLGLHSIEANVNPGNTASANTLKKLGFVQEAYFRENYYYNGSFLDSMIFSLLATKDQSNPAAIVSA